MITRDDILLTLTGDEKLNDRGLRSAADVAVVESAT